MSRADRSRPGPDRLSHMELTATCTACTAVLPELARFCPACGAPVVQSPDAGTLDRSIEQALGTELRHLTVVFCDLVGSTELSATTDLEEYSDLIQSYQQRAVSVARSYGGDVEGYSGDGILFRFGWPHAHDDDAAQAVHAALDIVDAVNGLDEHRRLAIRIGIHSGPVVVGELGGTDRKATMAVGETLNVSARLQGAAEPGTVVASIATVDQVDGRFELVPLGALQLRGVPEPIEAYRVVGRHGGGLRSQAFTRQSPIVGRDPELEILRTVWDRVRAGHGATVVITGEPGVGKSRLAFQVHDLVQGDDHGWLMSGCSPYTRMSVLRPVIDLVEGELDFAEDTDPVWRLQQVRSRMAEDGVDIPDGDGLVASLLGIPTPTDPPISAELRLERTIEALVAWVLALSRLRPLVLMIEDLHWCDPTTMDALDRLVGRLADAPILVLLTARSEFGTPWEDSSVVTTVALEPLGDAAVRELIATLGGSNALPEDVVDQVVASAGGIPLFVEEVGRTLLESPLLLIGRGRGDTVGPVVDLEIPRTLQASLQARLDSLGPARSLAQLASVLGRSFDFDLLVDVSGMDPEVLAGHLDRVVESGLLVHEGPRQSGEYVFKHVLVQEAAYESLLRRNRRTIHERVARELDGRTAAGSTIAPEEVARHYEAAGLMKEATVHFQRAARIAAERSGHREAIAFLRHGIGLARQLPDELEAREVEVEMQLAMGSSLATRNYADPELAAAYDRARELCELIGNDVRVGQTLGGLSVFYINRGEIEVGARIAERVLAIADIHGDGLLEVLGNVQLSLARTYQGRVVEGLDHARRAIAIYHPERHHVLGHRFGTDQGVAAHVFAGWCQLVLGHLDRGLGHMVDAVDLADALGQPFNRVFALFFLATAHWERGESEETLRMAEQARWLGEEQGFVFWTGISGVWEGAERVVSLGDHSAVAAVLEAGMAAGATGNRAGSGTVLARVAEATRAAGDRETTRAVIDMALAESAETGQPWWDSALLRMRAELDADESTTGTSADLDDPDHPWARAAASWCTSLETAERFGFPVHGARAASGYARLLQRVGRAAEGRRLLADWYGRCTEGRDTPTLTAIRVHLETLGG